MTDLDEELPPAPPVRNESTRNFTSFYSTNSSSSTSGSISTTSTNNTTCSSNTSNCSPNVDKPLPKTPEEDDLKKKTKFSLTQSLQALSNSLFPRKLNISMPINFYHEVHVTFNTITGEFEGMPEEWKLTLQNSSITLNERIQNPQAVIDALDFYHYQQKKNSLFKYMYSSEKNVSITPPRNTCFLNNQKPSSQMQTNLTNSSSEASSLQGKSDEELDKNFTNGNNSINQNELNASLFKYSNNNHNTNLPVISNSNYSSTPNPTNNCSLAQMNINGITSSSTSPTIQNILGNHSNNNDNNNNNNNYYYYKYI